MNDLNKELFERILLDPAIHKGASYLKIVSGYSSSSMVRMHIECLLRKGIKVTIELIVGMTPKQGIEKKLHEEFKDLEKEFSGQFMCHYIRKKYPTVHAKTYCWLSEQGPLIAFSGSANYSLNGFSCNQIEQMDKVDENDIFSFFKKIQECSINCRDSKVEKMIDIRKTNKVLISDDYPPGTQTETLTLLARLKNDPPPKSAINYGHRKGIHNQDSYINVPRDVHRRGFFPEPDVPFFVRTDDKKKFKMKRTGTYGNHLAIADNKNNKKSEPYSVLGRYFRKRIGARNDTRVTGDHLEKYGRNDVTFVKLIDGSYLLDFSVRNNPNI